MTTALSEMHSLKPKPFLYQDGFDDDLMGLMMFWPIKDPCKGLLYTITIHYSRPFFVRLDSRPEAMVQT